MRTVIILLAAATSTVAFSVTKSRCRVPIATRAAASDALRDAAVATYKAKFNKPPIRLPDIFAKSPVPENSLAGQEFYRDDKKETKPTLSKSEVPEKQLRATFATIAKLYGGEDNALTMVEAIPNILTYDVDNMVLAKTGLLKAFCGFKEDGATLVYAKSDGTPKYTEQDVIEMCVRNPLLIGVRATGYGSAENSKEDTMQLSYLIAATRPIGGAILGTLLLLLLSPLIKSGLGLDPVVLHLPGAKF